MNALNFPFPDVMRYVLRNCDFEIIDRLDYGQISDFLFAVLRLWLRATVHTGELFRWPSFKTVCTRTWPSTDGYRFVHVHTTAQHF